MQPSLDLDRDLDIDLDFARAAFPALAGDTVFMDNAGGSLTLGNVADRVRDYLLTTDVQHGASYGVSAQASARLHEARARFAENVGAASAEEIVFGPSSTILLQQLAEAVGDVLAPGDEIIATRVDHEANIGCWLALEAVGARVRFWERNAQTGDLALGDLDALLGPRTRMVCVTHASNIFGAINPIAEIARRARAAGAWTCVDGVAFAPHRGVDVAALGVDFYVQSLYKVYGPHLALLYARREAFLEVGSLNHFFYARDRMPSKLEPGNPNYELAWGAAGIVDYLEALGARVRPDTRLNARSEAPGPCATAVGTADSSGNGARRFAAAPPANADDPRARRDARDAAWAAITAHEEVLAERLLAFLRGREDLRIIGPTSSDRALRVPTIAFTHARLSAPEIVEAVDPHGIGIRHGHFHAYRLVEDLGLLERGGVVRVSLVHYNTLDEVDRLVDVLDEVLR